MFGRQDVFPFLVGCPRSGTTLLRAMLDAHSRLAIPGESHFIPAMARHRERYERPEGLDAGAFAGDLIADRRFRDWGLPARAVRAGLVSHNPQSLPDAFRVVYGAYAAHRGKPLYGDKTPGYARELPVLAELFPEARFVHLVRDGRDVVLSLREMDWAQHRGPLDTLARFWRTNVELASAAGAELGPHRYHEVRYEQLIDDPEDVLRGLCRFLGLRFEGTMLSYYEQPDGTGGIPDRQHHAHALLPPTKGLRDWRTQMSPEEVAQFEGIAGETLEQAGYARGT